LYLVFRLLSSNHKDDVIFFVKKSGLPYMHAVVRLTNLVTRKKCLKRGENDSSRQKLRLTRSSVPLKKTTGVVFSENILTLIKLTRLAWKLADTISRFPRRILARKRCCCSCISSIKVTRDCHQWVMNSWLT
jgi:hypothetical protein